ncbi:MAG: FAD-dependent oxidoreductase [Rhodospirillales bacterium]
MSETIEMPVLVVGAGPVGLALAGDLGWRGVPCTLIEQSDGSIYQPRQDYVSARTMEFCRRWGIVADVEASPYPRDYPQDNAYIAGSLAEGWEIGRWPVPSMDATPYGPESPQRRERCPQNMFDPILKKFASSFPHVALRYRHRFAGFAQDGDGVTVTADRLDTGATVRFRARYLVGCDGANSRVRDAAGIAMEGEPVLTYTTNVIFRCAGFERLHDKRPGYRFIFIDPDGTWATIVAINGRDQWRFSIIGNRHERRELSQAEIDAAIRKAVGRAFDYEILSVVPWTRKELVAAKYRDGRVLLAGDAVHCHSPTGGFGMNTGVADAVDLSWKLEAMLAGWGGPQLLDSYEAERKPVAHRNVMEASGNLRRMLSPGHNPGLLDRTPQGTAVRAALGQEFAQAMKREWRTAGIHLGYRYEGSPIVWPDGTPAPPYETSTYVPTARPGARAPHVNLADGRSTLDLFGRGFVLLRMGEGPDPAPLTAAAGRAALPLTVVALAEPAVRPAYAAALALIRPDGHVAWRGDALPADTGALIDRVRGAA